MAWNPSQYLAFAGPRMQPAIDLLTRVPLDAPESVVDLGCGPGNSTAVLARLLFSNAGKVRDPFDGIQNKSN